MSESLKNSDRERQPSVNKRDLMAAVVLFALAAAAIGYGSRMPFGKLSSPQAGFFPVLIAVLLAVLSIILFGQTIKRGHEKRISFSPKPAWGGRPLFLTIGALFSFILFFEYLGYLISTFLFMTLLLRVIGSVRWWRVLVIAFCTTTICYLLLEILLKIQLPIGFL
jgi:putative tricarboxylic transport membrane protein